MSKEHFDPQDNGLDEQPVDNPQEKESFWKDKSDGLTSDICLGTMKKGFEIISFFEFNERGRALFSISAFFLGAIATWLIMGGEGTYSTISGIALLALGGAAAYVTIQALPGKRHTRCKKIRDYISKRWNRGHGLTWPGDPYMDPEWSHGLERQMLKDYLLKRQQEMEVAYRWEKARLRGELDRRLKEDAEAEAVAEEEAKAREGSNIEEFRLTDASSNAKDTPPEEGVGLTQN